MGDDSLIPISDEQAKLGQDVVKAASGLAGWFADILGDFPKDLFGLLVSDRVKAKRIERIEVLWRETQERLRDRGPVDPGGNWSPSGRDVIAKNLKCSSDEVLVSFAHLAEMDCISFMDSTGPRVQPYMKPFGTLLMNVVND